MTFRTLSAILGTGWVLCAIGCILPDIHDDGPVEGSSGTGTATAVETGTGAGGSSTSEGGAGGGTSTSTTTTTTSGSGGAPAVCEGTAVATLRFANVAPAPGAVDFCLGKNGNLSGPVAKLAGAPGGVAFSSVMQYDYNVDGPVDVRVVPAGGSCSGQSLGDIKGLCLTKADNKALASVYYIAGQADGLPPMAVLEDGMQDSSALKLRFFNTVQGAAAVDFGLTDGGALPTVVSTAVASNIAFATFPAPGITALNVPVNEAGYLEITSLPSNISWQGWGVALSGTTDAAAVVPFSTVSNNMGVILTVIAAGRVGDPNYPIQFIGFGAVDTGVGATKPAAAESLEATLD